PRHLCGSDLCGRPLCLVWARSPAAAPPVSRQALPPTLTPSENVILVGVVESALGARPIRFVIHSVDARPTRKPRPDRQVPPARPRARGGRERGSLQGEGAEGGAGAEGKGTAEARLRLGASVIKMLHLAHGTHPIRDI